MKHRSRGVWSKGVSNRVVWTGGGTFPSPSLTPFLIKLLASGRFPLALRYLVPNLKGLGVYVVSCSCGGLVTAWCELLAVRHYRISYWNSPAWVCVGGEHFFDQGIQRRRQLVKPLRKDLAMKYAVRECDVLSPLSPCCRCETHEGLTYFPRSCITYRQALPCREDRGRQERTT